MRTYIFVIFSLNTFLAAAQTQARLDGKTLLQKTIAYHDPQGNWGKLQHRFFLKSVSSKKTQHIEFEIDNIKGDFKYATKTDSDYIEVFIKGGVKNTVFVNGYTEITAETRKKHRLAPDQIKKMRNYYEYLYGLPMKLNDAGTKIADEVKLDTFNGKKYWVLKIDYEQSVGTDTWFFYINTANFALEGYRFFHNRSPNDGEYVILSDIIEINGVKIPKVRKWFLNKDNVYLGTDFLEK